MHMYKITIKLGLMTLALAVLGLSCTEGDVAILGNCPTGQIMVGQAFKACLKAPLGAEDEVRRFYGIVEMKSDQMLEQHSTVVFDTPLPVEDVLQLLGSIQFNCRLVYYYDFASQMYNSLETPADCGQLRTTVVAASDGVNGTSTPRLPVILSVTGKGLPGQMLHFWRAHSSQVRAVSISPIADDPVPPQFKPFPRVEE